MFCFEYMLLLSYLSIQPPPPSDFDHISSTQGLWDRSLFTQDFHQFEKWLLISFSSPFTSNSESVKILASSTIFTAKGFLNHQRTESLFRLLSRSIWRGRFLDWSIRDVTKETTAEDLCWVWTSTWCHLCLMIIMVIVLIMMMIIMPAIVMTTASKD